MWQHLLNINNCTADIEQFKRDESPTQINWACLLPVQWC